MSFPKKYKISEEIPEEVKKELKEFSHLKQKLLFNRNIKTQKEADKFLNPNYDTDIHDPYLLPNMKEAVSRILKSIKEEEHITIFSDYDADGIPGAVVLSDFFRMIDYEKFDVYIPHRNKEGFGLNMNAIDKIADDSKKNTKLLITIDCGIADIKEVDYLKELNIDVIITDHHKPSKEVPDAIIVNHKLEGSKYPEDILCGAGVVFKLVQALILSGEFSEKIKEGKEKWLLDMVGVATLSDMVPLIGENRVLAHYGLFVLKKTPRKGIVNLCNKAKIKQEKITETDVGFTISPRINAASRMGEPIAAYEMLTASENEEALEKVVYLEKLNEKRKGQVSVMVRAANSIIENKKDSDKNIIAIGDISWQPSLLGLAASSLVDKHNKPVFLWGKGDGKELKGSCRGNKTLSVHSLLHSVADDIFIACGGHDEAGGFVVNRDSVDFLEDALDNAYIELKEKENKKPIENIFNIDSSLKLDDINFDLIKMLSKLAPFGVGNPEPVFIFENVLIKEINQFGKNKDHFKLMVSEENSFKKVEAMAFFKNDKSFSKKDLKENGKIDLIGTVENNTWLNKNSLRVRIVDIV